MIPPQSPPHGRGEQVTQSNSGELRRDLTLLDSTMINIGSMIGSGIFLVPATIALYLQSSWLVILVWIIGGIVSLFGALSVAELGAMYPKAGGQYVYLREAFGQLWGFLYGWTGFMVIISASISAVAVGFATYLGYFVPLSAIEIKLVAIASIVFLTVINCFGVKVGAIVQNSFTFLKMGALGALTILGFVLTPTSSGSVSNLASVCHPISLSNIAGPIGLALVSVLWSYDGWIEITYVAGEVRDPQRNLPRSLIFSTLFIIAMYVSINLAYMHVLPLDTISKSELVASDAATVILGSTGAAAVALAVMISTFGCSNGFVLTGARIYYAMAKERLFFTSFEKVHPTFHTPLPSLVGQGTWASLLVLTGTFDQLYTYVIFASWIFYGMSAGAVFILRKKYPGIERPYKTWGYPFTPIVFILFSLYLVLNTLIEDPRDSIIGLGIILLGLPAFFYWTRKMK
ncbi:MAG: amino acid permease [Ignavibacteriae bacterium]|nr:amino acid permease [Ignavibacteriota bacterium]